MTTALAAAGFAVLGVGLLLVIVGLVLLVGALRRASKSAKDASGGIHAQGVITDMTDLTKALTELIKAAGQATGVPLVVMILGILLVAFGAIMLGVSSL